MTFIAPSSDKATGYNFYIICIEKYLCKGTGLQENSTSGIANNGLSTSRSGDEASFGLLIVQSVGLWLFSVESFLSRFYHYRNQYFHFFRRTCRGRTTPY